MIDVKRKGPFGERLKHFRKRRGLSQLDLAMEAGSTPRYMSFIETGRSRPGREVVLRLSDALGLTLRECNLLLESAGLPPEFRESNLNETVLEPALHVIERVLENHNPFPAWSIGPGFRFMGSNRSAERFFPGLVGREPIELIDMFCAPSVSVGESERQKTVWQTITAIRNEMLHHPHPDLPALLERAESYAEGLRNDYDLPGSPVLFGKLPIGNQVARTIATILRFDKATDVTLSEIRVELIFPADAESERLMREAAE